MERPPSHAALWLVCAALLIVPRAHAVPGAPAAATAAITIEDARIRATAPGQTVGGGFMTVLNGGPTDDRLLRLGSPAAREVQMHATSVDGGVMRMRPLTAGVPVPARSRVTFKPGALHLMFIGLKSPLVAGSTVPVTLEFEHAGRVGAVFRVEPLAAQSAEGRPQDMRPQEMRR